MEENNEINEENESEPIKRKFWNLAPLCFDLICGFIVVMIRLFSIQVLDTGFYKEKSRRQHENRN